MKPVTPLVHPPVIWQIELDDALAETKMIAEAWDAAGLCQVGHFPGDRWSEWNGQYRDDIRRFLKRDFVAGQQHGHASREQQERSTPPFQLRLSSIPSRFPSGRWPAPSLDSAAMLVSV